MGRTPDYFAGRKITARSPFVLEGKIIFAANATELESTGVEFPSGTFLNTQNKPFEIHSMIPRVIRVDSNGNPTNTNPSTIDLAAVSAQFHDLTRVQDLCKQPTPLLSLIKGATEQSWEWAEPYNLDIGEGFKVTANRLASVIATSVGIRVGISFKGFLLTTMPPR